MTKRKSEEHNEQVAFTKWLKLMQNMHPELRAAFAIPNACARSEAGKKWMSAEGVVSGIPDYCIPRDALFLEFKKSVKEKPKKHQLEVHTRILESGNTGYVVTTWIEAARVVKKFFNEIRWRDDV